MKLKVTKLEFYINFDEAMSAECQREFSRPPAQEKDQAESIEKVQKSFDETFPDGFLIRVNAVVGEWNNPDGFLLRIGEDTHLIPTDELKEEPRNGYIGNPADLTDIPHWIVFRYVGSDSAFLSDIVKNYDALRFEGKCLF